MIYSCCESCPVAIQRRGRRVIGGKTHSDGRAEGSNLSTKPGSKCMCWPKADLHKDLQVPPSQFLCARSPRNWEAVSAVVLMVQPCCVPFYLLLFSRQRFSNTPDLAKIARILQVSFHWLSVASAVLEMGLHPKICTGRDSLGHPCMANGEMSAEAREKQAEGTAGEACLSGTATVLADFCVLLANTQILWTIRSTRTLFP